MQIGYSYFGLQLLLELLLLRGLKPDKGYESASASLSGSNSL